MSLKAHSGAMCKRRKLRKPRKLKNWESNTSTSWNSCYYSSDTLKHLGTVAITEVILILIFLVLFVQALEYFHWEELHKFLVVLIEFFI